MADTMKAEDVVLRPCPFCGGEARLAQRNELAKALWHVQCDYCDASQAGAFDKALVGRVWNTRAALSAAPVSHDGSSAAPIPTEDDGEACGICGKAFKAGDRCLTDVDLGSVHADCCGPEREGYVDLTTLEPLRPDQPIPEPWLWTDEEAPHPGAAENVAQWRGIETAPRDGTPILAGSQHHSSREVVCWQDGLPSGSWESIDDPEAAEEGWVNDGPHKDRFYANPRYFTHWMPLAAAPDATSTAEQVGMSGNAANEQTPPPEEVSATEGGR